MTRANSGSLKKIKKENSRSKREWYGVHTRNSPKRRFSFILKKVLLCPSVVRKH